MRLIEILVATTSYVVRLLSWSGVNDVDSRGQIPLYDLAEPASLSQGPIFKPPTGAPDDKKGGDLICNYSRMNSDWVACNTETDRGCWLRNVRTGKRYDINTNYELDAPLGITRTYYIAASNGTIDGDGMPFEYGKFFWNQSEPFPADPKDRYPGPWIQACWGDSVRVILTNNIAFNGSTIHWHGVRQNRTFESDGVPGLTQCPIAPGDRYVYDFDVIQYGSSWYHSHYSLQYADGAAGPMTFHGPTSDNWDEPKYPIMMTDWGHNSAFYAIWQGLGVQSTLLNGVGNVTRYNNTVKNTTEIPEPYYLNVASSRNGRVPRYLLRLINVSFESMFIFTIDNHMLTVVSTDFVSIRPYQTTSVRVNIGQRYNVILTAKPTGPGSEAKSFWMRAYRPQCYNANFDDPPSIGYEKAGIVYYDGFKTPPAENPPGLWPVDYTCCSDEPSYMLRPVVPWTVGKSAKNESDLTVNPDFSKDPTYHPFPLAHFSVGGPKFNPLQINYSHPMILNLTNNKPWQRKLVVYPEDYSDEDWVYLLIQNNEAAGHPIHLHGHDFAILGQSGQKYPVGASLNLNNPPRRDVVMLPANGWVMIAFRTDNPGTWLIHCHIAQHASFGLAMQILERQSSAQRLALETGAIARASETCEKWDTWYGNCSNWWYDEKTQKKGHYCTHGGEDQFSPDSGI